MTSTRYWNHSCESFYYVKGSFDKNARAAWQPERLYFLFAFCVVTENHQNNYFIQVYPLFRLLNSVTLLLFKEMLGFDGIITSFTIMKQVVLRKLACYESLVDIEVSKH